jgi:hypothetical protein
LYGCTWTGSDYIAVGDYDGTPIRSKDGIHWDSIPLTKYGTLRNVVWDGATCLIADGNYIHTSKDLTNWSSALVTHGPTLFAIAGSGSQYVTAGGGVIAVSPDGKKWQIADSALKIMFWDAVWTGSKFVLAGTTDGDTGLIATSADGLKWDYTRVDSTRRLWSIAWTGTQVVATGGDELCVSDDYLNWKVYSSPITDARLSCNGSTLYVYGRSGWVYSTTDFTEWDDNSITTGSAIQEICFTPTQALAVGWYGAIYKADIGLQHLSGYRDPHTIHPAGGQSGWFRIPRGDYDALGRKIPAAYSGAAGIRFHPDAKNTLNAGKSR